MNKDAQEKDVSDYDFLIQLCDCDFLFASDIYNAIDDIDDSDSFGLFDMNYNMDLVNTNILCYKVINNEGGELSQHNQETGAFNLI